MDLTLNPNPQPLTLTPDPNQVTHERERAQKLDEEAQKLRAQVRVRG